MTAFREVYKCNICWNVVEVLHAGQGTLVCCWENMNLLEEKNQDMGMEKHVPVIERKDWKITVKVGEQPHPMVEEHYIEWIEIVSDWNICRKYLMPWDHPVAEFEDSWEEVEARIYCNVHSLRKS